MKPILSEKQLQAQVRYFAYYQLIGSTLIIGLIILKMIQVESLSILSLLLHGGFLTLSGFAIYCGYLTLKNPLRGLQLSRISLLIQLLGFSAGGIAFRFFAEPFIALSLDLTNSLLFTLDASLAEFSFKLVHSSDTLLFSVNMVAVFLFFRTTFWLNEWHIRYN